MVNVLILMADGINCNEETARAFKLAGAKCQEVHINELLMDKVSLAQFQILAIPGGFSYGDDIKSGKILALKLAALENQLTEFLEQKKLVLGICNGFQVLTTLGLLPYRSIGQPFVSLSWNNSNKYECRWVQVRIPSNLSSPWLTGLDGKILTIQAAHAEGKLIAKDGDYQRLFDEKLIALQYVDEKGAPTESYPANPNGSYQGIAGLISEDGLVLGMMPHPERNVEPFHLPYPPNSSNINHLSDCQVIFKNAVQYFN